jgi:hypothetical protein
MPTTQQTILNPRASERVRGIEAWAGGERRGDAGIGEDWLHTRHSTECRSVARLAWVRWGSARIGGTEIGQAGRGTHTALHGAQQPAEQRLGGVMRGKEGIGMATHTAPWKQGAAAWRGEASLCVDRQCQEGKGPAQHTAVWKQTVAVGRGAERSRKSRKGQARTGRGRRGLAPHIASQGAQQWGVDRTGRARTGAEWSGLEWQPTPRPLLAVEDFLKL